MAFFVRRSLHEPEIFVEKHATRGEHSFGLLVKDGKTCRTTLGIAILCAVQNFAYYGIMAWMPSYLGKSLGFSLTKSGLWTATTVLGMASGTWVCGQLADRIGRKPVLILFQTGALLMVVLYSLVHAHQEDGNYPLNCIRHSHFLDPNNGGTTTAKLQP